MAETRIDMTVNGRPVRKLAGTHQRLLDFLRDDLNLTGPRKAAAPASAAPARCSSTGC